MVSRWGTADYLHSGRHTAMKKTADSFHYPRLVTAAHYTSYQSTFYRAFLEDATVDKHARSFLTTCASPSATARRATTLL